MFRGRVLEVVLSGEQINSLGGLCGMIIMNCFYGMVDRRKAFFLTLFPAGTIARDRHHRESLIR